MLIDEYDQILNEFLHLLTFQQVEEKSLEQQEKCRIALLNKLKHFYSILKNCSGSIRHCVVVGILPTMIADLTKSFSHSQNVTFDKA